MLHSFYRNLNACLIFFLRIILFRFRIIYIKMLLFLWCNPFLLEIWHIIGSLLYFSCTYQNYIHTLYLVLKFLPSLCSIFILISDFTLCLDNNSVCVCGIVRLFITCHFTDVECKTQFNSNYAVNSFRGLF